MLQLFCRPDVIRCRSGGRERLLSDGGVQCELSSVRRGCRDRNCSLRAHGNQPLCDGQLRPVGLLRRRASSATHQVLRTTQLPRPCSRRRPVRYTTLSQRLHVIPRGHLPLPARYIKLTVRLYAELSQARTHTGMSFSLEWLIKS